VTLFQESYEFYVLEFYVLVQGFQVNVPMLYKVNHI